MSFRKRIRLARFHLTKFAQKIPFTRTQIKRREDKTLGNKGVNMSRVAFFVVCFTLSGVSLATVYDFCIKMETHRMPNDELFRSEATCEVTQFDHESGREKVFFDCSTSNGRRHELETKGKCRYEKGITAVAEYRWRHWLSPYGESQFARFFSELFQIEAIDLDSSTIQIDLDRMKVREPELLIETWGENEKRSAYRLKITSLTRGKCPEFATLHPVQPVTP